MSAAIEVLKPGPFRVPPDGVYYDMPEEEYREYPSLSYSDMKILDVSPLQYWHQKFNPDAPAKRETEFFDFGRALHCAVLEPSKFESCYCREFVYDPDRFGPCLRTVDEMREWIRSRNGVPKGRTKAELIEQVLSYNEPAFIHDLMVAEHARLNEGRTILDCETWDRVHAAAEALRSEPKLQPILEDGKPEVSLFWTDPETGCPLKGRLDWMTPYVTLDVKTFSQKAKKPIDRTIAEAIFYERYYRQAWLYSEARRILKGENRPFVIAFVESDPPYETRLKALKPGHLYWDLGRQETRQFICTFAECFKRFGLKPWREPQDIQPLKDEDIPQLAWTIGVSV